MSEQNLRRLAMGELIAASLLFGALIVPAVLAGMMSPMAFDGGIGLPAVLLVASLLSFPPIVLASIVGSWAFYRRRGYRAAIAVSLLPASNLLVLVVLFNLY